LSQTWPNQQKIIKEMPCAMGSRGGRKKKIAKGNERSPKMGHTATSIRAPDYQAKNENRTAGKGSLYSAEKAERLKKK